MLSVTSITPWASLSFHGPLAGSLRPLLPSQGCCRQVSGILQGKSCKVRVQIKGRAVSAVPCALLCFFHLVTLRHKCCRMARQGWVSTGHVFIMCMGCEVPGGSVWSGSMTRVPAQTPTSPCSPDPPWLSTQTQAKQENPCQNTHRPHLPGAKQAAACGYGWCC